MAWQTNPLKYLPRGTTAIICQISQQWDCEKRIFQESVEHWIFTNSSYHLIEYLAQLLAFIICIRKRTAGCPFMQGRKIHIYIRLFFCMYRKSQYAELRVRIVSITLVCIFGIFGIRLLMQDVDKVVHPKIINHDRH